MPHLSRHHPRISASEIGSWCYCHKAWQLQRLRYPSTLANARVAGTKHHEAGDRALQAAARIRTAAAVVIVICVIAIIFTSVRKLP